MRKKSAVVESAQRGTAFWTIAFVILCLGALALLFGRLGGAGAEVSSGAIESSFVSDCAFDPAEAARAIAEQQRTGFVPYGEDPDDPSRPAGFLDIRGPSPEKGGRPLYASDRKTIKGYVVDNAGFVPVEIYEAPDFDLPAAQARYLSDLASRPSPTLVNKPVC